MALGVVLQIERRGGGLFKNSKKARPHNHSPATEGKEKSACLRQLIQHVFDLGGAHFAVIVVIQIAVNATFVATVSYVQMDGERNSQFHSPLIHLLHETHAVSLDPVDGSSIGRSETSKMPRG